MLPRRLPPLPPPAVLMAALCTFWKVLRRLLRRPLPPPPPPTRPTVRLQTAAAAFPSTLARPITTTTTLIIPAHLGTILRRRRITTARWARIDTRPMAPMEAVLGPVVVAITCTPPPVVMIEVVITKITFCVPPEHQRVNHSSPLRWQLQPIQEAPPIVVTTTMAVSASQTCTVEGRTVVVNITR